MKKIIKLNPDEFEQECTSVWSFPRRGAWATHNSKYRGNWSPEVVRNLLLRYSSENDYLLDPMIGGGTTAIECKLLNRNLLALDINPRAIELTKTVIDFECEHNPKIKIVQSDARNIGILKDKSIDFALMHPPYADIIHYSEYIDGDMSLMPMKDFLFEIGKVAEECYRVLKKDKFCAILMGDTRKKGMVQPLAFETMRIFEMAGFKTKEIIIKEQHNCKATGYWKTNSIKFNFLLLAHEYLFVFRK